MHLYRIFALGRSGLPAARLSVSLGRWFRSSIVVQPVDLHDFGASELFSLLVVLPC